MRSLEDLHGNFASASCRVMGRGGPSPGRREIGDEVGPFAAAGWARGDRRWHPDYVASGGTERYPTVRTRISERTSLVASLSSLHVICRIFHLTLPISSDWVRFPAPPLQRHGDRRIS